MKNSPQILSVNELDALLGMRVDYQDGQGFVSLVFSLTSSACIENPRMVAFDNLIPRLLNVQSPNMLEQAPNEPEPEPAPAEPAESSPPVTLTISDQGAPHES